MYAIVVGVLVLSRPSSVAEEDVASSWFPLQPGNTWVYQKESRSGNMARPAVERWTSEETIVSSLSLPEVAGTLVTKRTTVRDHHVPPGFIPENDSTKGELPESHLLIRQKCLYILDGIDATDAACAISADSGGCVAPLDENRRIRPAYRDDLLRGIITPDFCFPMADHERWSGVPTTSSVSDFVWDVKGHNADPFGGQDGNTFHLSSPFGSGTTIERWFEQGVGVLQEVVEHHGTYDEQRRQLVKTTLNGRTRTYRLTPARVVPLSLGDCTGPGWQHFVRADGSAFQSEAACASYFKQ